MANINVLLKALNRGLSSIILTGKLTNKFLPEWDTIYIAPPITSRYAYTLALARNYRTLG